MRSDNIIWKRVQGLDHPIHEEVVSYCCPEQKLFPFLELRILRLFPRALSAGPDISAFFS